MSNASPTPEPADPKGLVAILGTLVHGFATTDAPRGVKTMRPYECHDDDPYVYAVYYLQRVEDDVLPYSAVLGIKDGGLIHGAVLDGDDTVRMETIQSKPIPDGMSFKEAIPFFGRAAIILGQVTARANGRVVGAPGPGRALANPSNPHLADVLAALITDDA